MLCTGGVANPEGFFCERVKSHDQSIHVFIQTLYGYLFQLLKLSLVDSIIVNLYSHPGV